MIALLLFHFRAGIRQAMQSYSLVFAAALFVIMLEVDPAGAVRNLAAGLFSGRQGNNPVLNAVGALALIFSFSSASRMAQGVNGWMRHLAFTNRCNRRALTVGLMASQFPLIVSVALLGIVARESGGGSFTPVLARIVLVLSAAAYAAAPVRRQISSAALALGAVGLGLFASLWMMVPAVSLLVLAEIVSGPIRRVRPRRPRPAATLFGARITWRAVGWRILMAYAAGLLALGGTALFTSNNAPPPGIHAGAVRLGGCMAVLVFISFQAAQTAMRRPVWPFARSLPWSAAQRVSADALFLALHALPFVLLTAFLDAGAATAVLAAVPFLCLRAAAHMRRVADRRTAVGGLLVEGTITSALVCLLPWIAVLTLAAAPLALKAGSEMDRRLKATRWAERHHKSAGDSLSWSAS